MLRIQDLTLKRDDRKILRRINLTVKAGEIYSILGPNGAGKSSLAYVIIGCNGYQPDKGKIIFEGEEINNLPICREQS